MITPATADSGSTSNGDAAPIFSALARTYVSAARRASSALHGGLVGVGRGQARLGVHARDAEQEQVGLHALGRLRGRRAAR